jgi:hypothetical protein
MILGDMEIRLMADLARLNRDMNAARQTVSGAMDNISGTVKRAMGILASFGLGLGIGVLVKEVIDAQREFDKLNAALVTATGSTANAAEAFKALQGFAATTPFDLKQATEAFLQLRNLGLEPSERALTSFGNTAASKSIQLSQVVAAVADAATGQFERLRDAFGITAQQLGDNVALTFQGTTTMVKKTAKDIQEYLVKIGEVQFGGAMARQAATLDGAMSNLADTWKNTLLAFSTGGFGEGVQASVLALGSALSDLGVMIKALGGEATAEGGKVKEMAGLHEALTATFRTLAIAGVGVSGAFKDMGIQLSFLKEAGQAKDFAGLKNAFTAADKALSENDVLMKARIARIQGAVAAQEQADAAQAKSDAASGKASADRLGKYGIELTAEAKRNQARLAIVEIEERITGVTQQSAAEMTKIKTALETGAITQEHYNLLKNKMVEANYQASLSGKEEVKSIERSTAAIKARADQQALLNDRNIAQIAFAHEIGRLNDADFAAQSGAAEIKALQDQKAAQQALLALAYKKHQNQVEQITLTGAVAAIQDKIDSKEFENKNRLLKLEHEQYALAANNYADMIDNASAEAKTQQDSLRDQINSNAQLGMTEKQIAAVTAVRLLDQAARADERAALAEDIDWSGKMTQAYRDQAEALRGRAAATTNGAELKAQKDLWNSIDQTAHDTFVSIFDSGKSAFDRLRDTLKNGLMDLLYQMVIKKWVLNIGASVGLTGASSLAQAATGTGGIAGAASGATGVVGMAQTAATMYKAISGGFSALSGTVADAVQVGMYETGMTSEFLVNGAIAKGAGAFAGVAAGALGGIMGGRLISGQYGSNATVNAGTAIGAAVGSVVPVIGTAIGALVGGLLGGIGNRLFGMGDKKVTATGMSGTLSDAGLSGTNYQKWNQDGGWFRSDKSGTDKTAFDPAVTAQFVQGFATIKAASAGFAASVGASTDSLAGYSKTFDIALTSDKAANEKAITDFFTGVGDEVALRLVPSLAQFNKSGETMATTLQRLAGDFDATNQVAMLLGKNGTSMFGSLGIDSAAARERLIDLSGGVQNLSTQATAFAQNYLSDAERIKPVADAVSAAMDSLGRSGVTTREQFKNLVQSLDVTTDAGAKEFASLMALSDAFAQVHPAIESTVASVKSASQVLDEQKDLQKQINQLTMTSAQLRAVERKEISATNLAMFDQVTALQNAADMSSTVKTSISNLDAFRKSIMSFSDSQMLGSLSPLTAMQKDAEAKRQYEAMLAKANTGDETARAGIQAAATAFLTADQIVNASSSAYVANFTKVQSDLASLAAVAGSQMSDAQQQLAALDQQVSQLAALNATANSIETAISTSDWSGVGTANMGPLVDEIKGLRADNADLKADNAALKASIDNQTATIKEQTAAVVQATLTAAANNAETVTAGAQQAAKSGGWAQNLIAEVTKAQS